MKTLSTLSTFSTPHQAPLEAWAAGSGEQLALHAPPRRPGAERELMGLSTLLGNDVYNDAAEDLGRVREFMIDRQSGAIAYVVLSFDGASGSDEKLFALPWAALRPQTQLHRCVLDVQRSRRLDAPGFDRRQWPDRADAAWAERPQAA